MPRLTDRNEIRTRLRRDRAWSVYALGDLEPLMFPKTLWFVPDLTLVVQDYGTAILFAMGPGSVREALASVKERDQLVQSHIPDGQRRRRLPCSDENVKNLTKVEAAMHRPVHIGQPAVVRILSCRVYPITRRSGLSMRLQPW
jgi:hypothetical protein